MWTKERQREYNRAYYIKNRDKIRSATSAYSKTKEGIEQRAAYAKNNPDVTAKATKAWREKNAEKRLANGIVNDAIRRGKLIKPDACSRCGKTGRIHGHHPDYSKPLEVMWLCHGCHIAEHH